MGPPLEVETFLQMYDSSQAIDNLKDSFRQVTVSKLVVASIQVVAVIIKVVATGVDSCIKARLDQLSHQIHLSVRKRISLYFMDPL